MRAQFFSILIIINTSFLYSQTKKFQVGIIGGYGISGISTKYNDSPYRLSQSYELGVAVKRTLDEKLDFRSGATYTRIANYFTLAFEDQEREIKYKSLRYYLEVPIGLNYNFSRKAIRFYFTGGIKPNLALFTKSKFNYIDRNGDLIRERDYFKEQALNNISLKFYTGFGWAFDVKSTTLFVEPVFSHAAFSLSGRSIKGYLPYTFFLNGGILF